MSLPTMLMSLRTYSITNTNRKEYTLQLLVGGEKKSLVSTVRACA